MFVHVCVCSGVCVCVMRYIQLTQPDLQPGTETLADQRRQHADMSASALSVSRRLGASFSTAQSREPPPPTPYLSSSLFCVLSQAGVCVFVCTRRSCAVSPAAAQSNMPLLCTFAFADVQTCTRGLHGPGFA